MSRSSLHGLVKEIRKLRVIADKLQHLCWERERKKEWDGLNTVWCNSAKVSDMPNGQTTTTSHNDRTQSYVWHRMTCVKGLNASICQESLWSWFDVKCKHGGSCLQCAWWAGSCKLLRSGTLGGVRCWFVCGNSHNVCLVLGFGGWIGLCSRAQSRMDLDTKSMADVNAYDWLLWLLKCFHCSMCHLVRITFFRLSHTLVLCNYSRIWNQISFL